MRTQKLKMLLKFYQILPNLLCDFYEICSIRCSFQDAIVAKIWMDLLKGLLSYWGFKLRGLGSPKFLMPPSGESMLDRKSFGGARMCLRFSITVPSWWGFDFTCR